MATATNLLQPVREHGWRRGFANLLDNEHRLWWGTHRWIVHLLVWLALINGTVAFIAFGAATTQSQLSPKRMAEARFTPERVYQVEMQVFFQIGVMATAIGAIISTQGAIIREKQVGTAAWVLSKPASRPAFVLSKFIACLAALLALAVALPGAAFYGEIWLFAGRVPPPFGFLAGLGVWVSHLLFYLALTFMLGTVFSSRGPVLGIALGFLFAGSFVPNILPQIVPYLPWPLSQLALVLALGPDAPVALPQTAIVPVIATVLWTTIFIAVALWRFSREEF
jgi:ABC-2 type transport system permease protein